MTSQLLPKNFIGGYQTLLIACVSRVFAPPKQQATNNRQQAATLVNVTKQKTPNKAKYAL